MLRFEHLGLDVFELPDLRMNSDHTYSVSSRRFLDPFALVLGPDRAVLSRRWGNRYKVLVFSSSYECSIAASTIDSEQQLRVRSCIVETAKLEYQLIDCARGYGHQQKGSRYWGFSTSMLRLNQK